MEDVAYIALFLGLCLITVSIGILIVIFVKLKSKNKTVLKYQKEGEDLEKRLTGLTVKYDKLELENKQLKTREIKQEEYELVGLEDSIEELQQTKTDLDKVIDLNRNKLKDTKREYKELENQIVNKKEELEGVLEDVEGVRTLNSTLTKLNKDKEDLTEEVIETQIQLDKLLNWVGEARPIFERLNTAKGLIKEEEIKLKHLRDLTGTLEIEAQYQEYGVYRPTYDFVNSTGYKDKLREIRAEQKELIKTKKAVNYRDDITVDGSLQEGKKLVNNGIKQILRAFNNECDVHLSKVKTSNVQSISDRIDKSRDQLNDINRTNYISISETYLHLKQLELRLVYEYELKKEEEKEVLRLQREQEREEAAVKREIEGKKKKAEKDVQHFNKQLVAMQEKLKLIEDENERMKAEQEISQIQEKVETKEREKEELDHTLLNAKAGHVYIISNIGAFGKDVVKIGVTRRLEPKDRIKELSGASVPFTFDTHALVFSEDAYDLETKLHNHFDDYRVNKVNNRKEFFKIPITEIEDKLEEFSSLTTEFEAEPKAEEYYQTLEINKKGVLSRNGK